jgi:nitrogen regulatory protein PII
VNKVVDELEQAGAPGITIVEIHPVGYGYEPNYFEERFEDAFKRYSCLRIVKVEIVCSDKDVKRLAGVIERVAHTGGEGDGMIFIAEGTKAHLYGVLPYLLLLVCVGLLVIVWRSWTNARRSDGTTPKGPPNPVKGGTPNEP